MSSLNSVSLIGRLGADPEARAMPSGESVVTLSLATSEKWKDKETGEKRERTEWHRVVFFGRIAEVCDQYLHKGDMIYVGGSLRTRKWTDKQGVERYSTEIVGGEMKMLVTKPDDAGSAPARQQPQRQQQDPTSSERRPTDDFDSDIPF